MAVLSRPWPFYHGKSSQAADCQILYYPSQSVYQRGPSHFQQKPAPMAVLLRLGLDSQKSGNVYQLI